MADYVIIDPDGTLTEGDGYPHQVGCEAVSGRNLHPRARNGSMWRLVRCTDSLAVPEKHPLNDVARLVLTGLGRSIEPEEIRGPAALLLIGVDFEGLPIPPKRLELLRRLATVGRSLDTLMDSPADIRPPRGGVRGPQ